METHKRLDPEWVTLNAVRDLIRLAAPGDDSKATYSHALDFGAAICPEILGADVSILRQDRESNLTKEYRQKAACRSIRDGKEIKALSVVNEDIDDYESLVKVAKKGRDRTEIDKFQRKLNNLYASKGEIELDKNSENQLIFRDALKVDRGIPMLTEGKNNRTFELSDNNLLTIHVLHPEIPEHITGADLIYERFDNVTKTVVIAFIQYKIWEHKKLNISDNKSNQRMLGQIEKMREFLCMKGACSNENSNNQFRFPFCSAFLRPTDKLQSPNQKFMSIGEHLPVCHIDACSRTTSSNAKFLEYKNIKKVSLSHEQFEDLFTKGKIGSKPLSIEELTELYKDAKIISKNDRILLYAQEYSAEIEL